MICFRSRKAKVSFDSACFGCFFLEFDTDVGCGFGCIACTISTLITLETQ